VAGPKALFYGRVASVSASGVFFCCEIVFDAINDSSRAVGAHELIGARF
jgi:hypothetical protein